MSNGFEGFMSGAESAFETAGSAAAKASEAYEAASGVVDVLTGAPSSVDSSASLPPWVIDPTKYSGRQGSAAYKIRDTIRVLLSMGASQEDIFSIARLPNTAGLAPKTTTLQQLDPIGRARMVENAYVIAAMKHRSSPAELLSVMKMIEDEVYGPLGFRDMGRDNSDVCNPNDVASDGYRSIQTGEVCPPRFMPSLSTYKPTQDAISRLLAVVRGQIPESGTGVPGADPMASAVVGQVEASLAQECFDRAALPSPQERLDCISGYESQSPGTVQRLLLTHKPWEAGMKSGKMAQVAPGMDGKRYFVFGKVPGFGLSTTAALAGGAAAILVGWWAIRNTKPGKRFAKRYLKI